MRSSPRTTRSRRPSTFILRPTACHSLVRQFLDFTENATAERIVQSAGYVNQSLTRTPLGLQGERLSNAIRNTGGDVSLEALQAMVTRLERSERLSPTFRFADGAAEMDTQSRAAARRLATAIEAGFFDGRTLLFAGFSDSAGSSQINTRLAQRRAEAVLEAVRAAPTASTPVSPCARRPLAKRCPWPARTPPGAVPSTAGWRFGSSRPGQRYPSDRKLNSRALPTTR
jgi:outer membrane protein OmpA-like peptidoglycan-associated protein